MERNYLNYLIFNYYEKTIIGDNVKINSTLRKYLKNKCNEQGATLNGRIESFVKTTGAKQKPCIYINDRVFFIPNRSMNRQDVFLINYWMIQKIKKLDRNETLIMFKDKSKIAIGCDYRVLNKQMDRCATYISKML